MDSSSDGIQSSYDFGSLRRSTLSHHVETTSGPSRFDLPEVEDYALGVFSSFDDITYDTKPIVQAPENSNNTSYNANDMEEDKRKSMVSEMIHKQRNSNDYSDDEWTGPKSIMKHHEDESSSSKKVRFDFEEKENIDKTQCISSSTNPEDSINNHAKIIKEVLKKYPHLVKNNKNIRLKIMQKESKSSKPSVSAKTKVSYVVLKSDHLLSNSEENSSRNENADGAETGPWKCSKCDLEEEYTNYYMYRRHMQDVHEQKFDPRVCEHCGYKATKRNILMYHLYTKHNVPPPQNMCFPKCHACSYVALSENLLVRHQINHKHRPSSLHQLPATEGIKCMQCSQSFKDVAELASHEISTGHGTSNDNKEKTHRCPHCGKTFVRLTNLHVHLDCAHKELRDFGSQSSVSLKPSTEAEALSNVVSGIATSLGVDQEQSSQEVNANNEYIVPEIENISNAASQEFQGQQMLMLIDGGTYEHQVSREQDTDGGMIVYIQENDVHNDKRGYDTYHSMEIAPCQEEIVEEVVEELEELEEEVIETNSNILHEQSDSHMEDEIQYVEEETEIVEYNEGSDNGPSSDNIDSQEAIMIIEEEQLDEENDKDRDYGEKVITSEWDVDKTIT